MELTTEYLIIIEKSASEAFYHLCDSVDVFQKLLRTDPNICVDSAHLITYKQALKIDYEVKTGRVEGKEQRFFVVRFTFTGDEADLDEYTSVLRSIRTIIHGAGGQPETLRDDVSFHYAKKAYPLIHSAENLMRKLITYFMLTNVGKEWVTEASPLTVREAIDKSKRKQYVDALHQIDFIHLGDFLFKAYQTRDVVDLYQKFESVQKIEELNLADLREFRARSNWERYFSKVVDCTDEYLDKRWKQLYDLRCVVAHNGIIGRAEYDRTAQLVDEVDEHLQKAVENLDKIQVPREDREQLAENVVSSTNTLSGNFISLWKSFENTLARAATSSGEPKRSIRLRMPVRQILQELLATNVIDEPLFSEAGDLYQFRNRLLHDASVSFSEQEITSNTASLERVLRQLRRTWKDEVASALQALGGKAALPDIYEYIENNTSRELPDNWQAAIRNILQTYSSDAESYKGGEDLFQHLDTGYWGLRIESKENTAQ
jgi:hypothetical protein